ncbi:uncharacterized protein B0T23DRAFT_317932, partial [Neurospora hispaniola]
GSTLNIAILDILKRDFQVGLTYVACSRVKTLQGLIFDTPFDLSALRIIFNYIFVMKAINKVRRLLEKFLVLSI